jgi:hypothetical protein
VRRLIKLEVPLCDTEMASWNDLSPDLVGLIMAMRGELCAFDSIHRGELQEDWPQPLEDAEASLIYWTDLIDDRLWLAHSGSSSPR